MLKIRYGWIQLPFMQIDRFIWKDGFGDDFVFHFGWNTYLTLEE